MVVSNLTPSTAANGTGARKGKAKEILADPVSLAPYRDQADPKGTKNVQISVPTHPKLYAQILETLAQDKGNLESSTDGKIAVKRSAYTHAVRAALANSFNYEFAKPHDLVILTKRGTAGLISLFQSTVADMFETVRAVAGMGGVNEDQVKAIAFERARKSVQSHPQLAAVEITDELLEALWVGADIDIDDEDDDDDDDAEDPTTEQPQQNPTPAFS